MHGRIFQLKSKAKSFQLFNPTPWLYPVGNFYLYVIKKGSSLYEKGSPFSGFLLPFYREIFNQIGYRFLITLQPLSH